MFIVYIIWKWCCTVGHGTSILRYLLLSWGIYWDEVSFIVFDVFYYEVLWQVTLATEILCNCSLMLNVKIFKFWWDSGFPWHFQILTLTSFSIPRKWKKYTYESHNRILVLLACLPPMVNVVPYSYDGIGRMHFRGEVDSMQEYYYSIEYIFCLDWYIL